MTIYVKELSAKILFLRIIVEDCSFYFLTNSSLISLDFALFYFRIKISFSIIIRY